MTIYTENYTANITIEDMSFLELERAHWEHNYETEDDFFFESMTVDYNRFDQYEN